MMFLLFNKCLCITYYLLYYLLPIAYCLLYYCTYVRPTAYYLLQYSSAGYNTLYLLDGALSAVMLIARCNMYCLIPMALPSPFDCILCF